VELLRSAPDSGERPRTEEIGARYEANFLRGESPTLSPENVDETGDSLRIMRSAAEVRLVGRTQPAGLSGSGRKGPEGLPDRLISLVPGEQSPQPDLNHALGQNGLGHARREERCSEHGL
jgi:hypothetical protein